MPARPSDDDDLALRVGRLQALHRDGLAVVLGAQPGREQRGADLGGADLGERGAVEVDGPRPAAHVVHHAAQAVAIRLVDVAKPTRDAERRGDRHVLGTVRAGEELVDLHLPTRRAPVDQLLAVHRRQRVGRPDLLQLGLERPADHDFVPLRSGRRKRSSGQNAVPDRHDTVAFQHVEPVDQLAGSPGKAIAALRLS